MIIRGLFQNKRVAVFTELFIVLTLAFLAASVFKLGGDSAFNLLNSIVPTAAALLITYFSYQAWINKKDPIAHDFWRLMTLGFGCWGLAEAIWLFYAAVLKTDIPYPSLADLAWLVGYIPLVGALWSRLRTLKVTFTHRQLFLIIGVNLLWLIPVVYFILLPILRDWDSGSLLGSLASVLYPIGDLGLVVLASLILILMQSGRFAFVWQMMITGIIIMTLSDQLYTFASAAGLYYPDEQVNFITNLTDTSYTLSYFFIGYGIFLYRVIWDIKDEFELSIKSTALPRFYAFIATNQHEQVINFSNNLFFLVKDHYTADYSRQPVEKLLGLDPDAWNIFVAQVKAAGKLANYPLCMMASDGEVRTIWATALAIYNPGPEYVGMNLALRADIPTEPRLMLPDDREVLGMLRYLQDIAGSHPEDRIQTVRVYFLETVELFSLMLYQFGGEKFRAALFEALRKTAAQENLLVKIEGSEIHLPDLEEAAELARVVQPLLQTARRFTVDQLGEPIVRHDYQELEKRFSAKTLQELDLFNLRLLN